jgi:ABC-type glycerol-3-phosphate transport system substrate-binding protein
MQRKSLILGIVFFLTLLQAGCGDSGPPVMGPDQKYKGVVVRVACPADAPAEVVRTYSRGWMGQQGATVTVVECEGGKDPSTVEAADVWVIPSAELPRWAAEGKLAELPREYKLPDNSYRWQSLLPLYREKLLSWDQKIYGLPLLGESPLCCYRTDKFDDANKEAFAKLHPGKELVPATWEDFAEVAAFFASRPDREHSLPPLPEEDAALEREFYTIAACFARRAIPEAEPGNDSVELFSFHYDLKTGEPRIDGPGFVRALQLLQRMQAYRPEKAGSPEKAFREGQAVFCLTNATRLQEFQTVPSLRNKFGICSMPGGGCYFDFHTNEEKKAKGNNRVPYLGADSWLAVVPKGAANAEAAFALLADLSGPQTSGQIVRGPRWGGGILRDMQLANTRWDDFDLDYTRTNALKDSLRETLTYRELKNPALRLRIPDEASHRAILVTELRSALANPDADASKVLTRVAQRWKEVDQARGEAKHLAEYRMSVGLLPD